MSEFEKIPEKRDKFGEFQKKYNNTSKSIVHMLGTNMVLLICCMLPLFLIGSVWTDFGTPEIGLKYVSDGIVTVALFIIGEMLMMRVGADGGKLDTEYVAAKKEFHEFVGKVNSLGTIFMSVFCEWQIDVELEQAISARIKPLRFTRAAWEKVKDMSYKELKEKYGKKKAKRILKINQLEPVEINEAVLMYDNTSDGMMRGGIPVSGESYLYKKTHSVEMVLSSIFTGLLTVSIAINLTQDLSFARVMYTVFKLILLLYRMAIGYEMGAKAYNTVEANQYKAKSHYLQQYIRFVEDKVYLDLGDKYEDMDNIIGKMTARKEASHEAVQEVSLPEEPIPVMEEVNGEEQHRALCGV